MIWPNSSTHRTQRRASQSPTSEVNLETIAADEARAIQSEEQKILGYRPPADSLAAQAQSAVDSRADDAVRSVSSTQEFLVFTFYSHRSRRKLLGEERCGRRRKPVV